MANGGWIVVGGMCWILVCKTMGGLVEKAGLRAGWVVGWVFGRLRWGGLICGGSG